MIALDSLCNGPTQCAEMHRALDEFGAGKPITPQNRVEYRAAVAKLMQATVTGRCPWCQRRVR